MSPAQCRAARALLNWKQETLGAAAGVSVSALRNFEAGRSRLMANNVKAIVAAFAGAGVEFIAGGVRLIAGE